MANIQTELWTNAKRIRYGIKGKLMFAFIALALVPFITATYLFDLVNTESINRQFRDTIMRTTDNLLSPKFSARDVDKLTTITGNAGFKSYLNEGDPVALTKALFDAKENGQADVLIYTDEKGQVKAWNAAKTIESSSEDNATDTTDISLGDISSKPIFKSEEDMSSDPLIKSCLAGKSLSGIQHLTGVGLVRFVSMPLLDGGKVAGVLKIGSVLNNKYLNRIGMYSRSELNILDNNDKTTASSVAGNVGKSIDELAGRKNKNYNSGDIQFTFERDGKQYVGMILPIHDVYSKKVGLLFVCTSTQEAGELLKSSKNMKLIRLFSIVAVLVIGWIGFLLATKISTPIKQIEEGVQSIISGNFHVNVKVKSKDEIGLLAVAFNQMARELKTNIERLKELDRMKTDFLNTVSHELRTPLTSIKAFSELLLDNKGEDMETQMRFLQIINEECDRLTRLINELLDLSRIESGRMVWNKKPIYISKAIQSAIDATQSLINDKKIEFVLNMEKPLPRIKADFDKLQEVIINLLSNSVKFTPEGGRITVSATGNENWITVSVADTGIGIPEEFLEKVFDKFQQVESEDQAKVKGTGLGLAIVRSYVEGHGGRVWAESEPGKGSTFHFSIPAEAGHEHFEAPAAGPAAGVHDEADSLILIVDDEPNIRLLLRNMLEGKHYKVIEASGGAEAIEKARQFKPRLITLDLLMPDLSGFDVLTVLKNDQDTRDIPIMVLSIMENADKSFSLGAAEFISKPLDRELFLRRINELIGEGRGGGKATIMVVDDDPAIIEAVVSILEDAGHNAISLTDGSQVAPELEKLLPDLIILDIYMPEMNGFEVLHMLKHDERTRDIPIVILTASSSQGDMLAASELGAAGFYTKAYTTEQMRQQILEMVTKLI